MHNPLLQLVAGEERERRVVEMRNVAGRGQLLTKLEKDRMRYIGCGIRLFLCGFESKPYLHKFLMRTEQMVVLSTQISCAPVMNESDTIPAFLDSPLFEFPFAI